MRPAWVEVDLSALRQNLKTLRDCIDHEIELMVVIKGDAYGHGSLRLANFYREEGVRRFAVAIIQEGIELRCNGFEEPILILGHTPEEDFPELIKNNLTPTIYTLSQAEKINQVAATCNKKINIHIKIDTGMGRLGFATGGKSIETIVHISRLSNIFIEGIYTHLATADRLSDQGYVNMQYNRFMGVINDLEVAGLSISLKHMCNSAATINFPQMHLDMVRPGTSLYGLYPGPEMANAPIVKLIPAMSVKARLVHIKQISIGSKVSYSGTFTAKRPTVVGIVPMGYVDGVFRQLANKGNVLLKGQRCQIIGNICMDQFMIDITDVEDPQVGDEVVFIGKQGEESITADDVGALVNTISVEVVTRMGKRMPIVYLAGDPISLI